MPIEGELWIVGNDDATGIGALGVAAGLIAEEAQFTVHFVLFEDTTLAAEEREGRTHTIRPNPETPKDHLKATEASEVLVRQAIQGSLSVRPAGQECRIPEECPWPPFGRSCVPSACWSRRD